MAEDIHHPLLLSTDCKWSLFDHNYFWFLIWGIARTQSPTNKNYALELPTFGAIVGVSQTEVQWDSLILEEPPS